MKRKIIIINGSATSGKDEFVKAFRECALHEKITGVINLSTINTVKAACERYFDVPKELKTNVKRKFWSDIKDLWTAYNDGPYQEMIKTVDKLSVNPVIFFIHVREPKEIQKLQNYYGDDCMTLLVHRPGGAVPNNHADSGVAQYPYDSYVINDSTLDGLKDLAATVLKKIMKEFDEGVALTEAEEKAYNDYESKEIYDEFCLQNENEHSNRTR